MNLSSPLSPPSSLKEAPSSTPAVAAYHHRKERVKVKSEAIACRHNDKLEAYIQQYASEALVPKAANSPHAFNYSAVINQLVSWGLGNYSPEIFSSYPHLLTAPYIQRPLIRVDENLKPRIQALREKIPYIGKRERFKLQSEAEIIRRLLVCGLFYARILA